MNSAILDLKTSFTKFTNDEKTTELDELWQENQKLKDENNALTERIYMCALRILQNDVNHQAEQWAINKNSRSGKKKDGARSTKTSVHNEHESGNPLGVT
jgi:cell shape-determining protein MreC